MPPTRGLSTPVTFDDDFIRVRFLGGRTKCMRLKEIGMTWPPPEHLEFATFPYRRISISSITDEERRAMKHVARGAEYESTVPENPLCPSPAAASSDPSPA